MRLNINTLPNGKSEIDFGTFDNAEIIKILEEKTSTIMQYMRKNFSSITQTFFVVNQKVIDSFNEKCTYKKSENRAYHLQVNLSNGLKIIFLSSNRYYYDGINHYVVDYIDNIRTNAEQFKQFYYGC